MRTPVFKSGYVVLIGLPNAGKSTLLNGILGSKLAAVSPKPQTTRHQILGIHHGEDCQVLFLDTPGLHALDRPLNDYLLVAALRSLADADVVLYLLVGSGKKSVVANRPWIEKVLAKKSLLAKTIFVLTKADLFPRTCQHITAQELALTWPLPTITLCAFDAASRRRLLAQVQEVLPPGPCYYPQDQLSDRSERFFAAEIIREAAWSFLHREIPYGLVVEIRRFEEKNKIAITADVIVEKSSHKPIVIGRGGLSLKRIGTQARIQLEKFLGRSVFLELFVRVEKDWTKDQRKIKEYLAP